MQSRRIALVLGCLFFGAMQWSVAYAAERFSTPARHAFKTHSWQPVVIAPRVLVQEPSAPPLPFVYMGKILQDDGVLAFVNQGGRIHLLRKGDALPPYQVDDISATEITFIYLPLHEKQRLTFGSAN